jgi:hypothetical protein
MLTGVIIFGDVISMMGRTLVKITVHNLYPEYGLRSL